MSTSSCRFCAHANPEGAKFCNDCGSPLHLKPCPHCEAITDVSAADCHQCGAPFVAGAVAEASAESGQRSIADDATGAAPEIRPHIPESLAACLAGDGGSARARDDVAHYIGAAEAGAHAPDPDFAPARDPVVSSRKGVFYRASFVVAPIACAVVGYYAYYHGASAMRALTGLIVIARGADDAPVPAAAPPAVLPPVAAPVDVTPAPKNPGVAAPSDQPAAELPREAPGGRAAEQAPKTQRLPVDEAALPTPRPAAAKNARARKAPDAAAIATQRLVARDTQDLAAPKNGASPAGTDRDAVATRRLITRELGEFLPSSPNLRSDDSSSRTN